MKKLLLTTTIVFTAFATPAMAAGCTDMIAQFDSAIVESKLDDTAKAKAMEMREHGAKQQAAGDEKACVATLTEALKTITG